MQNMIGIRLFNTASAKVSVARQAQATRFERLLIRRFTSLVANCQYKTPIVIICCIFIDILKRTDVALLSSSQKMQQTLQVISLNRYFS
jgi:hypothetical protein